MIISLVLRTGAVVAVIMATNRLGIWDSSDDPINFYNKSRDDLRPHAQHLCQYLNIHVPDMPPDREKSFLGIYYYNQTVMTIFNFLTMCPIYLSMVLEKVPEIVSTYGNRAREAYNEYQRKRAIEKERKEKKVMIDDKALVMPLEPRTRQEPDCECDESTEQNTRGLVPKKAPQNPYSDNYCAKSPTQGGVVKKTLPETKCKCPKCDRREGEGWLDNKSRCPKRDPCAKQFNESTSTNNTATTATTTTTTAPRKCDYPGTRIIYSNVGSVKPEVKEEVSEGEPVTKHFFSYR